MKVSLVFDGPPAAERFRLLHSVKEIGIQRKLEARERTLDDTDVEADLEEAFQEIGVAFAEAKDLGTVRQDILDEEQDYLTASKKEGLTRPFKPRTASGVPMLFLRPAAEGRPAPRMELEKGGTYKHLVALVEKAAPMVNSTLTLAMRDLRKFLKDAADPPKVVEPAVQAPVAAT